MKLFKNAAGTEVFAYEDDGSQDDLIPPDYVAITQAEADAIRNAPPPRTQLIALVLAQVRAERAPIIVILDGLQSTANSHALAAMLANDTATATAQQATSANIETAKQGLKNATALDLTPYNTYEEMRQAFKAYYASLVQGASPEVVLAFKASS